MARGNQRDKAREKNLKEQAAKVSARSNAESVGFMLKTIIEIQEHRMSLLIFQALPTIRA